MEVGAFRVPRPRLAPPLLIVRDESDGGSQESMGNPAGLTGIQPERPRPTEASDHVDSRFPERGPEEREQRPS